MSIPHHPDQHDESASAKKPFGLRAKVIIAAIVALVIVMIVLHIVAIAPH